MSKNVKKNNFFEVFISFNILLMWAVKITHKRGSQNKCNPPKSEQTFLTKKCCYYLGEELMKTVLCPSKIGLTIV